MIRLDSIPFDSETLEIILRISESKTFDKGQMILNEGQVCRHLFLVETGLLRLFFYDKHGNDITHWFAAEEMLLTDPASYFNQTPSFFSIQAIETTTVKAIYFETLEKAFEQSQKLERLGRMYAMNTLVMMEHRIIDWQVKSAEERYVELIENYPNLFKRTKLGHIASYLGITQQSLSRIRANL